MSEKNLTQILEHLSSEHFWQRVTPTASGSEMARLTNQILGYREQLILEETLDSSLSNLQQFERVVSQFEGMDRRAGEESPGAQQQAMRNDVRNRAVYMILSGMKKKIEFYQNELSVAKKIQQNLLPRQAPEIPGYEILGECRSCQEVGGDSYYYHDAGESFFFLIADVSGKGLPAALVVAGLQAYLAAEVRHLLPLNSIIAHLNDYLTMNLPAGKFVTLFFARLFPASGVLQYVNCGHNPPVLTRQNGTQEFLTTGGPVIGMFGDEASYVSAEVTMAPGDLLSMFTDGVTEAEDEDLNLYGDQRFQALLRRTDSMPLPDIVEELHAEIDAFTRGFPATDDVTLMLLRRQ